ncbi:MAG: 50S ribosomal protein L25 [Anaerolineae bacterium]|nr:50S ribosomal protein L25 [Anaerolineae bacterium]
MKDRVKLASETRKVVGKKVKRLRAEGWIPGVLYGSDIESTNIKIEERELNKALQEAGATALIDIHIQGEPQPRTVLAREIQRDVLTSRVRHVDFFQVRLDHTVRTSPALNIVGTSPIVESGNAVLIQILTHIEVECLPGDLIDSIDVDVSPLQTLSDSITVADLPVPTGITIMADPDDVVVSVVAPRAAVEKEIEEGIETELKEVGFGEGSADED